MTKEYAKLILPHDEDEDLDELWELKFWEHEKYFLTHAPIPLVWDSKLKRLQKEYNAYLVLTDQEEVDFDETVQQDSNTGLSLTEDFVSSFHQFQEARALHKLALTKGKTPKTFIQAAQAWLIDETNYAQYWACQASKENDLKVAQSQESNPMDILLALQESVQLLQSNSISALKENYNILPEIVQKEVKRLTLLAKI